jgi:hypothetical protein
VATEYIIYADESQKKGAYYSHFYGGALVRSVDLTSVRNQLETLKQSLNLFQEIKWEKVTDQYLNKYLEMMRIFFDLIAADKVKVRIMFTSNVHVPTGLDTYQRENEYFLLYYQFIKYAFGLEYSNTEAKQVGLRIYLDKLPDTNEKRTRFKGYLAGLNKASSFEAARIAIRHDQIAEVDGREHVVLECLDIVLGSMQFRLNNLHQAKLPESNRRGKRTIAKDKLYKYINQRIRGIYPSFNIGVSTGLRDDPTNRWNDSYRHWLFVPSQYTVDRSKLKHERKR